MLDDIHHINQRVDALDKQIHAFVKANDTANRLMTISGIGPITASALVATTGDPHLFKNSRQFTAWLGLVPKQFSSGGKNRLGGITKSGDGYLRKLLIQGARAVLFRSGTHTDQRSLWITQLRSRKPDNVVATALAAKLARTAWAIMTRDETYQANHTPVSLFEHPRFALGGPAFDFVVHCHAHRYLRQWIVPEQEITGSLHDLLCYPTLGWGF